VARAEAAVERSRERVERLVGALRDAVARRTDWRGWIGQRSGAKVAAPTKLGNRKHPAGEPAPGAYVREA